ncbi:Cleft lip and palate transmembrane protein 1 like protein [Coemansia erecta]|uniref:Cleft lip and palate transmembrane protein 1 like protein n=1 Tax=Coemansia erecta TaxID=147472 RepID=A0A9W8CW42_9FUNG|nr:Cleft lip and palate transmembrane protein 1 like protein [Coemansia erecta]
MGLVGKASSVLAFGLFVWWIVRIAAISLRLFYPTTHIPIIDKKPEIRPDAVVHSLAWQEPFEYAASMYVSTMETFVYEPEKFLNTSELVWHVPPQSLGQRYPKFSESLTINLPESVRSHNGTRLYAFLLIQKAGFFTPNPDFNDKYAVVARAELTGIRQRTTDRKHLLLTDSSAESDGGTHQDASAETKHDSAEPWVPHAKTRLHWEIVLEDNRFYDWRFPLDLAPHLRVNKQASGREMPYVPLAWENPLAVFNKHWAPLTNKTSISRDIPLDAVTIQVEVSLSGVVLGWFRLCNYASQGLAELTSSRSLIQYTEADVDNLKEMVYEVNPLMLAITLTAMALHMLFEFLAYKEDVSFWSSKSKDSMQGISRSSMLMSLASSLISFLYMWDRRAETNIVVILGAAVGAVVEAWKVSKILSIQDILPFGRSRATVQVGGNAAGTAKASESESESSQTPAQIEAEKRRQVQLRVDKQTGWYMTRVCVPAMAAYAAFSLIYQQHESYVSWFLNISLITVYTLEFIQMWPQLLINHELKTVDMLPLTAFLYRFLLTFIDDLYALVVPMPLIERIGTLRDDVVFIVLCYQWYKFPRRKPAVAADAAEPIGKESKKKTE